MTPVIKLAPIEEAIEGVDPAAPTQEQLAEYAEYTDYLVRDALSEAFEIRLEYPSGAFDILRLDEEGDPVAIPTDAAPQPEPDPEEEA